MKRHKELNSLMKENRRYKDQEDELRKRFGSLEDIKDKMELAAMKEEKVNDLLSELDQNLKS